MPYSRRIKLPAAMVAIPSAFHLRVTGLIRLGEETRETCIAVPAVSKRRRNGAKQAALMELLGNK